MEYSIISKSMVRGNKTLRRNQKVAKKFYGKVRRQGPKLRIQKLYDVNNVGFVDLTGENQVKQTGEMSLGLTADGLIKLLRKKELTGLSGNGFSTADKLEEFSRNNSAKSVLILNSVECDPGLAHDEWLLKNRFTEVKTGVEVLRNSISFQSILLATKLPLSLKEPMLQVVQVPNRYPMGYEKTLVKILLGEDLSEDEYPAKRGILVLNIQTVLAIGEIVGKGKVLDSRYLTVEDLTSGKVVVVRAKLGMDVKEVIAKALPKASYEAIYVGEGAMNGHLLKEAEKISAVTNYIAYGKAPDYDTASKCKGCGGCSAKCPMQINVKKIVKKVEGGDRKGLKELHPERCIGCNSCTYICSAGKNLKELIASVKEQCAIAQ